MKSSKFMDAQNAFIIKQEDYAMFMAEVCSKAGNSLAAFFNWKKKYAGRMPSESKRRRELEQENVGLKKIVADLSLDMQIMPDVIKRKS